VLHKGLLILALTAIASCVAPARSFSAYEGKAAKTADDAASAAETALIAVRAAAGSRAFAPAVSVALAESEDDATSAQGTFESIQPPDARSDRLRADLGDLLDQVTGILSDLRIAARRGELGRLTEIGRPLPALAAALRSFSERHS
jgi:hypothetical protein